MKKEETTLDKSTPDKVDEWVTVGTHVGDALIGAAGKLGVAADTFLNSKTGKVTIAIIVWKMMGGAIVHIAVGVTWLIVFSILWVYFFRRMCVIREIIYDPIPNSLRRKKTVSYYDNKNTSKDMDDIRGWFLALLVIGILTGILITFTY